MKKLLLLTMAAGCSLAAMAQNPVSGRPEMPMTPQSVVTAGGGDAPAGYLPTGAEGLANPFYLETYGSGTNTTMPTGWTTTGNSNFATSWKWRRLPTTSSFSAGLGALNSPTGGAATASTNDGWMVYDSDSIGSINTALLPIEGYLTSPIISCAGRSTVQISFYQYFRRFRDSCFLDVSNNSGGTWTRFSVEPNNTIGSNTNLPTNATFTRINISSVAANQANVRIRFYYKLDVNTGAGGAFAWMVDDVALSELDPVELSVDNGIHVMTLRDPAAGYTSFGVYPKQLVDSVYPIGFISNYGATAQPNASISARIFRGGTQVYNRSIVYNVPTGATAFAVDSQLDYTTLANGGYVPTDTGLYTIAFNVAATGDAFPANNNDTTTFRISDSTLSVNVGTSTGSYFVQNPVSATNPVLDFYQTGVWFEIPANKSDTLSSITTSFDSRTTVGSTVVVQVYKQIGTGTSATWQLRGETFPRTLAAGDISVANQGFRLINIPMDATVGGGIADLILDGGYYSAVVRGQGNPATNTILLPAFQSAGFGTVFSFGTTDTSDNQPFSYTYGAPGLPPLYQLGNNTPIVRPCFGTLSSPNSVANVSVATLGTAYPNPANTKVTIPVSLSQASEVSVSLSNAQGQVLGRQELGKQAAGRGFEISFPTGNLANGVYVYTVNAAGEKKTGRVVVAH